MYIKIKYHLFAIAVENIIKSHWLTLKEMLNLFEKVHLKKNKYKIFSVFFFFFCMLPFIFLIPNFLFYL